MTKQQANTLQWNANSNVHWLTKILPLSILMLLLEPVGSLATLRAHAQAVSASLVGTISDSTGAGIVGAKVTILEMATGISRDTTHE